MPTTPSRPSTSTSKAINGGDSRIGGGQVTMTPSTSTPAKLGELIHETERAVVDKLKNQSVVRLVSRYAPLTPSRLAKSVGLSNGGGQENEQVNDSYPGNGARETGSQTQPQQPQQPQLARTGSLQNSNAKANTSANGNQNQNQNSVRAIPLTEILQQSAQKQREASLRGSLRLSTPNKASSLGQSTSTSTTTANTLSNSYASSSPKAITATTVATSPDVDPLMISTFIARHSPSFSRSSNGGTIGTNAGESTRNGSYSVRQRQDPVVSDLRRSMLGVDVENDLMGVGAGVAS